MRFLLILFFSTLIAHAFAQDTIRYKPVMRVSWYPNNTPSALKADEANALMITCPAMDEDQRLKGLRYTYYVKDNLAKIVQDKKHPGVILVYPNAKLMKKYNTTLIEIETRVIFPNYPVYIPKKESKLPLYDENGMVIAKNASWIVVNKSENRSGDYILATETFSVVVKK